MNSMRKSHFATTKPAARGCIETISAGYALVNRHLWILVIPVVVNLFLFFGPRLSFAPFLSLRHDQLRVITGLFTPDPLQQEELLLSIQNSDMRVPTAWTNVVPLLPDPLLHHPLPTTDYTVYVRTVAGVIGAVAAVNLIALVGSALFLTMLAFGVRQQPFSIRPFLADVGRTMLFIAGYFVLIIGGVFLIVGPLVFFFPMVVHVFPDVTTMVPPAILVGWFWLYVYTAFAIEAIALYRVSPWRAIVASVNVAQHSFLQTLGLILISFLIVVGLGRIWVALGMSVWGVCVVCVGSSYIGSGLSAARFLFYQERATQNEEASQEPS